MMWTQQDIVNEREEAGIRGYGYRGSYDLSVAHQTQNQPVLCPSKMVTRKDLRMLSKSVLHLALTLRALPGLIAVVVMMRGEKAINRYHHSHPGLDMAIILLAGLAGFVMIAVAVLMI